jgi:NAD(P)-dependent dehydrogenase (short-subunit alcohol dehydrogenase family)
MRVLVTGATRGIGQAIAQHFFHQGHKVYGTGTSVMEVPPKYLTAYYAADFTDRDQIEALSHSLVDLDIEILINNAGINRIKNFLDITPEDWEDQHMVNVYAPYRLSQAVIPSMQNRQWGRIVNMASVWSRISKTGRAAYSANKFALDGMTKAMAAEFGKDGILINCVSPGFIDTELTRVNLGADGIKKMLERVPLNLMGNKFDVAELVLWLASNENKYMTGQNLVIDGGFTSA